jgi:chromosome segregation ATPase
LIFQYLAETVAVRTQFVVAEVFDLAYLRLARPAGAEAGLKVVMADGNGTAELLKAIDANLTGLRSELRGGLTELKAELVPIKAKLDGLPILNRHLITTQREVRMLTTAFNDFALENATKGEIEALHEHVDRVQAENVTLQVRLETVERLIRELQEARDHR